MFSGVSVTGDHTEPSICAPNHAPLRTRLSWVFLSLARTKLHMRPGWVKTGKIRYGVASILFLSFEFCFVFLNMRITTLQLCLAWALLPKALAWSRNHYEISESTVIEGFQKNEWLLITCMFEYRTLLTSWACCRCASLTSPFQLSYQASKKPAPFFLSVYDLALVQRGENHSDYIYLYREKSQALEKEWNVLQQKEKAWKMASVDCSTDVKLCKTAFAVFSFPTIRLFAPGGGSQTRYRGPKTADAIRSFYRRMTKPAVSIVNDKNITSFRSLDDVVVIGHFGLSQKDIRKEFVELAEQHHTRSPISFAIADYAEPEKRLQVECMNNLEDTHSRISDLSSSPAALERFVEECATPLIPSLTRRNELYFYRVFLPQFSFSSFFFTFRVPRLSGCIKVN